MSDYYNKYLKYKAKYLALKKNVAQSGGSPKTDIYLFKAEWCGHCVGFKPTWNEISSAYKTKYNFITLDADANKAEIKKWNIQGYPTIIKKVGNTAVEFNGTRDKESIIDFINSSH